MLLVVKGVPRTVFQDRDPALPVIVHGLLQHEHKRSVLHFLVQRNTEYTEPIKAKVSRCASDKLIGRRIP